MGMKSGEGALCIWVSFSSNVWDAIKEVPELDDMTRFIVGDLLNTKAKKDLFL